VCIEVREKVGNLGDHLRMLPTAIPLPFTKSYDDSNL
jgi:hypothetical protein